MFGSKYYLDIKINIGGFRSIIPRFRLLKACREMQISFLNVFISIVLGEYCREL